MKPVLLASVLWCEFVIHVVYGDGHNCGGSFTSNYGEISSPNYPKKYPNGALCKWTIEGAVGTRLAIVFTDLELGGWVDCGDALLINSTDGYFQQITCKNKLPLKVTIYERKTTITLNTDRSITYRGFKLYWKVFTEPLGKNAQASWERANAECEEDGGMLMEADRDYIDTYQDSILEWMKDHNVPEIWVRKYFTPWVWLKGCFRVMLDMDLESFDIKDNQQTVCQNLCSRYNYFGLKDDQCICLNDTIGEYVQTKGNCTTGCPGNRMETCGGIDSLTVYKNDICFENSNTWNGTLTYNIKGDKCMNWKETTWWNSTFSNQTASEVKNFCRDPTGHGRPWCVDANNTNTVCDVDKCIDKHIQTDTFSCIALQTTHDSVFGIQKDCNDRLMAVICEYLNQSTRLKDVMSLNADDTWFGGRQYCTEKAYSFLGSISNLHTFVLKDTLHWTGYSRNISVASRPNTTPDDCFKLHRSFSHLNVEAAKCTEKLPFMCQKGPINCGQNYVRNGSSFLYPSDGSLYENDMNCVWKIVAPEETFIQFEFFYNIESCYKCSCDSLKIYDASRQTSSPILTLCGIGNETFNSTGKDVILVFQSDRSIQSNGIRVLWKFATNPSKLTTTTYAETTAISDSSSLFSTVTHKQGSNENTLNNKGSISVGLVVGVTLATLVAVSLVIVCIVVWRHKQNKSKETVGKHLEMNPVQPNVANQLNSANDVYAISSKVINKRSTEHCEQTSESHVSSPSSALVGSERENVKTHITPDEYSTVITASRSRISATDTRTNSTLYTTSYNKNDARPELAGANLDDNEYSYNALNEDIDNKYINRSDNVYNHVQGTDNDAYDHTTHDLLTSGAQASYSHVRGPFPTSKPLTDDDYNIANALTAIQASESYKPFNLGANDCARQQDNWQNKADDNINYNSFEEESVYVNK